MNAEIVNEDMPQKSETARASRWYLLSFFALVILAGSVRLVDVWRPVDGTMRDSWREPDVAGIARNFYQEGMNIFLPRIDWRGDGPGYTESEFPIYPWLVACLYHAFGYHEEFLRLVSWFFSMGACLLFFRFSHERLSKLGALAAAAIFTVNPLAVRMASAIQPEPLMFLGYLAGVYFFLKWCEGERKLDYWIACAATMLAILAKVPALHIGLLFACLCLQHFGWRSILRRDVWQFVVIAVGVPAAWYAYSHTLWLGYGNSLGMSNEAFVRISSGSFVSALKVTLAGNAAAELNWIWTTTGVVAGMIGLLHSLRRRETWWLGYWAIALIAYYVVAGRTTGEGWATHYHIVSAPLAAMLIGLLVSRLPWQRFDLSFLRQLQWRSLITWRQGVVSVAGLLLVAATVLQQARLTKWDFHPNQFAALHSSAVQFREFVEPGSLIVASGDGQLDQFGLQRAFNAPYFFFWMDAKGFTLTDEDQSVEKLEELRDRGARYFVGERRSLAKTDGFQEQLRDHFLVLSESDDAILVELRSRGPSRSLSSL